MDGGLWGRVGDGGKFLLEIVRYPHKFLQARRDRDGWDVN